MLLARHGRTRSNAEGRFCGRGDPPLDELGRAQARALGRWVGEQLAVPLVRVVASPATRAVETARPLAEPERIDGLAELDQGELEGMALADALSRHAEFFAAWKRDPVSVRVPGGETLAELDARSGAVLDALARELVPHRAVTVVTHQFVQAVFLARRHDDGVKAWRRWQLGNGQLRILGRGPDGGLTLLSDAIAPGSTT
jgi:probable phosphoglycerate mutase